MLLFSSSLPNQDFWAGSAGAEGGSVTFHLQDLKGEKLAWSFNGDTMLTITLGESLNPSFFENAYKSRVTFPNNGSSLTISQLGKKDAGTYTAKNSVYKASFTLRVHSVLREPEVTCVSWNCSADGCRYVLRCAVHTPGVTSFVWSHGEQLDAEEPELVVEKELPPGELDVLPRTCTVRNPVSSRNVTVSPAAVCTGESPQRIQGWGLGDTGRDGMHPDPSSACRSQPLQRSPARGLLVTEPGVISPPGRKIFNPSTPGAPATGRICRHPPPPPPPRRFLPSSVFLVRTGWSPRSGGNPATSRAWHRSVATLTAPQKL
uniref:Uncharacterized protein n=1 Tax=Cairina moschata TaxID=8855 RepID=A0A8C3GJ06_CAIMO